MLGCMDCFASLAMTVEGAAQDSITVTPAQRLRLCRWRSALLRASRRVDGHQPGRASFETRCALLRMTG
ncbi:hypothetical protein BSN85_38305 [Bradyrhizobium brasilense]|nr:hypothetical protein BSN85_38305 [Bradyrhizobium brasilense]